MQPLHFPSREVHLRIAFGAALPVRAKVGSDPVLQFEKHRGWEQPATR